MTERRGFVLALYVWQHFGCLSVFGYNTFTAERVDKFSLKFVTVALVYRPIHPVQGIFNFFTFVLSIVAVYFKITTAKVVCLNLYTVKKRLTTCAHRLTRQCARRSTADRTTSCTR